MARGVQRSRGTEVLSYRHTMCYSPTAGTTLQSTVHTSIHRATHHVYCCTVLCVLQVGLSHVPGHMRGPEVWIRGLVSRHTRCLTSRRTHRGTVLCADHALLSCGSWSCTCPAEVRYREGIGVRCREGTEVRYREGIGAQRYPTGRA